MKSQKSKQRRGLSDLDRVDCKTGFHGGKAGQMYRSWSGGRCRVLGGEGGTYCYHVMSRTVGGDYMLGGEEKEALRRMMRRMARFCGVEVLTYCIMDNHFHILVRVPDQGGFLKRFDDGEGEESGAGEERLFKHLSILYSKGYIRHMKAELEDMRKRGMGSEAELFLGKYKRRFCDLSLFVKELKERFSRWYNKKHGRRGTMWMDRFKSVLVEDGEALRTMAAYIDLNPVRAKMVEDPKDYRWSGYGEAVGGSKRARRGLCRVMEKPLDSWSENGSWYRCWLLADGEEVVGDEARQVRARPGISAEKVTAELAKGGEFSRVEDLLNRLNYLTRGLAFGSRGFVEKAFERHREKFGPTRTHGAKNVSSSSREKTQFYAIHRGGGGG